MQPLKTIATMLGLCVISGAVIYGGIFLSPRLAGSTPLAGQVSSGPKYLYTIGDSCDLKRPNAVAVHQGRVYVTDAAGGKVFIYSEKGRKLGEFGKTGNEKKDLVFPNGIVVTGDGNLMVADSVRNDIKVFSPKGEYIRTLKLPENTKPGSMYKGPDGLVYVSDLDEHRILVMDERSKLMRVIDDRDNPLNYPQGAALDPRGRLWVADSGNYAVKVFDPAGKVTAEIRSGGEPDTPLSMVRGIAFDRAGRAFVSDTIAHRIRIFDLKGRQLSVFSMPEGAGEELVFPTGLLMGPDDKLYVVDRGEGNVKVFALTG